MGQIASRQMEGCPRARGREPKVFIPLAHAAQESHRVALRFQVLHGPIHEGFHVALAPGVGMHRHGADPRRPQRLARHQQGQRHGADHGADPSILPHQIVISLAAAVLAVQLGKQPAEIVGCDDWLNT